jgi:hypothetical protein
MENEINEHNILVGNLRGRDRSWNLDKGIISEWMLKRNRM